MSLQLPHLADVEPRVLSRQRPFDLRSRVGGRRCRTWTVALQNTHDRPNRGDCGNETEMGVQNKTRFCIRTLRPPVCAPRSAEILATMPIESTESLRKEILHSLWGLPQPFSCETGSGLIAKDSDLDLQRLGRETPTPVSLRSASNRQLGARPRSDS